MSLAYTRRVPGTVIYVRPGDRLRIHVKNADIVPHSFHVHGVRYGIDSDGSWPFGTQSDDGRRSDEICPGQTWTYTYDVTEETIGAWPFHDHCRNIGTYIDRGLFGGLVVLPEEEHEHLPKFPYPDDFHEHVKKVLAELEGQPTHSKYAKHPSRASHHHSHKCGCSSQHYQKAALHPMALRVRGGAEHLLGGSAPRMVVPVPGAPRRATVIPAETMSMPMPGPEPVVPMHGMDFNEIPAPLVPYLATLDEIAHAPHPMPKENDLLHVPIFFHVMSGSQGTPVFQSAPLNPGASFMSPVFTLAANYDYMCGIHGPSMSGKVIVQAGGPSTATVTIGDFFFSPASITVGIGGQVTWINSGPSQHSVLERGGDSIPSYCFNGGRSLGTLRPFSLTRGSEFGGTCLISISA